MSNFGEVMNKIILKLVFSFFIINNLYSIEVQDFKIEARCAAFFPSSKRLKEIYGNVGPCYQIETSFRCGCWDIWENVDWFSKHGNPKGCHGSTRMSIVNYSLGIKYPYSFCECISVYAGIGPSLGKIWIKNKTYCSREKKSKVAIGGVIKTGVYYSITRNLFLDLFVDYLYQPVSFKKRVDIGGLKTGVGIGLKL